jgi:hypothetical protein
MWVVSDARVRYRISFRMEDESGFHQLGSRTSGTLWGAVQEINDLLGQGAQIIGVKKERWQRMDLDRQEKDTISMLTHGRVKL